MNKVALIIIYNHQYNKNIEIVERIYKNRFSHIYHLVPFYVGEKKNVIPVYGNSYFFQGYVAQGLKGYFKEEYTHYFFIGDDLVLNPLMNENNYYTQLRLKKNSCFIPRLSSIAESQTFWSVNFDAVLYDINCPGVEAKDQLPSYNEALQFLKKFGIDNKPLEFNQIWETPKSTEEWYKKIKKEKSYILRLLKNKITKKKYHLSYPLVRSYSDIFVVSGDVIKKFCHYCGVFASTRLFVELGIPTSLVFSANHIITEKDLGLKGRALWTKKDFELLEKYNCKIKNLLQNFPDNHLYLHPIKLSKWG